MFDLNCVATESIKKTVIGQKMQKMSFSIFNPKTGKYLLQF